MTPQRPRSRPGVPLPANGVPCPSRSARGALVRAYRLVIADSDAVKYWINTHEHRENTDQYTEYQILGEGLDAVLEHIRNLAAGALPYDDGAMIEAVSKITKGELR